MAVAGAIRREREGFDRINAFRLFARKWGMWDAFYRSSRERSGDHADQSDNALSWRKAFEDEFERCFVMVKQPDMAAVERAAKGEISGART